MVDIYLNVHGSQVPFLSIPDSDVRRLSIHPFKWLRYVMFCICGARGDLSATPDGTPVDYDSTSLADIIYYYGPSENCIFVDYEGLNDRITTTSRTARRSNFREEVIQRDGFFCVITQQSGEHCDAAHLIPWSKGDKYIDRVVRDRSPFYPPSLRLITGIDDVLNGVLLGKNVHSMLASGEVAFLKTPNYGLEPTDIPRVGPVHQGLAPRDYITLQPLKKPGTDNPVMLADLIDRGVFVPFAAFIYGAHVDAQFQGTGIPLPPAIILDYLYGIAAYNCLRSRQGDGDVHSVMKSYRREHYADIPPRSPLGNNDDNPPSKEEDDPSDPDYDPNHGSSQEQVDAHGPDPPTSLQRRPYTSIRRGGVMATAMDELNSVLMSLQGITPQEVANRREKRMEEELRAQEASRSKVMEWMKIGAVGGS
ncbi:hypothetical protein BJV78DRAFT_1281379 [Lactifluus subvellereus]|nr:hypothetical protein BJV78DRAFT_1281379 [Lactifluus subvellereus]